MDKAGNNKYPGSRLSRYFFIDQNIIPEYRKIFLFAVGIAALWTHDSRRLGACAS